jgi:hypothetical protein
MPELKNPEFIKNTLDPRTGKQVKSVWELDRTSIKRPIRRMIWQYYKHRGIMSIETLYKKTYGKTLEFIYFNDHNIYEYINIEPKIETII